MNLLFNAGWVPISEKPENDEWYVCYCPIMGEGEIYSDNFIVSYYEDGWLNPEVIGEIHSYMVLPPVFES